MSVVSPVVGRFFSLFLFSLPTVGNNSNQYQFNNGLTPLLHCCQEEFRLVHWWVRILVGIPLIFSSCSYTLGFLSFLVVFLFLIKHVEERKDVNSQTCSSLESVFPECGSENEGWKTKPPNCRYPEVECWLYRSLLPFRAWPLTLRNRTLLWVRVRHSLKVWQTSGHLQAEKQKNIFAPTATSGPQRHSCGCCKGPHQGVFLALYKLDLSLNPL